MSDVFIPVDLDKLLDDFEEQDSSSVSSPRQSSVIDQGLASSKTFPISGFPTNNSDTSLNNGGADSDSFRTDEANSGKLNIDLLPPDVTVSVSSLIFNASPQSNGEAGHHIEPAGQRDFQHCSSSRVDNLMDLTDVEVSSRSSVLNEVELLGDVVSQSDEALSPDITNGTTDEITYASENNLPNGTSTTSVNLTNSLHRDLLLLDIGNPSDDSDRSNLNYTQTFTDNSNGQKLLNKEAVKELSAVQDRIEEPGSNLISMHAEGFSHGDNENSLIDLTTEVTKQNLPDSLIDSVNSSAGFPTKSSKENFNEYFVYDDPNRNDFSATEIRNVEIPGHDLSYQDTQATSTNLALMDQAPMLSNNLEALVGTNSSTSSDPYNIECRASEFNRASDDNDLAAISNIPLLPEEGESSLLFMQDHFGNSEMVGDTTDNINTSVCVNSENYFTGANDSESNSEIDGTQETQDETIPVAQDTVAEASEEPATIGNSYEVLEPEQAFQLGYSAPPWVPDSSVNRCMSCQCKFTVVKRRHHCRACGKIYCSSCCNLKFNLQYLEDKLARVCQACANVLLQRRAALTNQNTSGSDTDEAALYVYLNPDQPQPPVEQRPSHDVEDVYAPAEQPPEYEETEVRTSPPVEVASVIPVFTDDNMTEAASQVTQFRPTTCSSSSSLSSADIQVTSNVPLPPIVRKTDEGLRIDDSPNHQEILYLLKKRKETVTFLLNKNLVVKVKIVKLNCCVKRKVWCFSSEGMQAADQEDMVILLECIPKESSIPQDVLSHFNTAFAYAKQGHRVTDLGYTIFGQPFLGSLRNAGFLYIKSSFQCLENLVLPSGAHIFGILIQREEVSWVQLFPIRLILRLGAEYRYYPSPLWCVRDREPLFGEIGHTIMDLLADFKNFQYTLPRVTGMHVHLEDKKAVIQLPQNRYDEVLKVLNATDEYVMAFEATFSNVADSHLVCIQEGTGYKTQSINLEGLERKVTGASFVVFNGALKTTTDVKAKVSIVEDGVMVQMVRQLSEEMRQAMREMSDFTIHTGCPDSDGGSVQQVVFEWVSKRSPDVQSVLSPIDGLTLGTTSDIKINTHFDFSTPSIYRLRWTQLFFLERTGERPRNLPAQFKQTTADIAKACTVALRPYLYNLYLGEKHRIGLRVNLSPDMVGYIVGSQGSPLPDEMANNLDNELVPAIHNAVNPSSNTPTSMEFLFNIVEMLS